MNTFLYARPSFIAGAAAILDFGNSLTEYNYSITDEQADFIALLSDWVCLGDDFKAALKAFEHEIASSAALQEQAAQSG